MGARALAALRMVWGVGGIYGGGIKWNHVGNDCSNDQRGA
jgi:hypothetical protein